MSGTAVLTRKSETFQIQFEVKSVMFMESNSKFAIAKSRIISNTKTGEPIPREMTVQGTMVSPFEGDIYEGEWF